MAANSGSGGQDRAPEQNEGSPPPSNDHEPPDGFKLQQEAVRSMARHQLTISEDSPFSQLEEWDRSHGEEARLLREETEEIKRQLDVVRGKLNEFNTAKENARPGDGQQAGCARYSEGEAPGRPAERKYEYDQQLTSSDSQFHKSRQNVGDAVPRERPEPARLRPLTGKTDCPNCECDRRRQSVCDNCAGLQAPVFESPGDRRRPTFMVGEERQLEEQKAASAAAAAAAAAAEARTCQDYDERPIRPAAKKLATSGEQAPPAPEQAGRVGRELVPSRVFTISRSLDEKRAQLARAIEELQLIMAKVRKRGDRLEQERKLAQLYREQWRLGPTIGGGGGGGGNGGSGCGSAGASQAGAGQARGKKTYQSRLDPQLARDSNSLMGFQHIEPALKLRQYNASNPSLNVRSQPCKTPQPRPRRSKMAGAETRMASVAQQNASSSRLANSKLAATAAENLPSSQQTRSKSLDSLNHVERIVLSARPNRATTSEPRAPKPRTPGEQNFHEGKSTSALQLAVGPRESAGAGAEAAGEEEEEAVEEELEEEEAAAAAAAGEVADSGVPDEAGAASERKVGDGSRGRVEVASAGQTETRVKKMSWVPVFGETEIKMVDRRQPNRKTLVLGAQAGGASSGQRPPGSILRQHGAGSRARATALKQRSHSAMAPGWRQGAQSPVMREAAKKLQFASNLLESERRDSRTRNQLIVSNRTRPAGGVRYESETQSSFRATRPAGAGARRSPGGGAARELVHNANREIGRLEEMIGEQQRVLVQLSKQPASCCCGQQHAPSARQPKSRSLASAASSPAERRAQAPAHQQASQQLIAHLRERLNKTKARLARTLEEERAKHEQLERRVHSSLRRQSDLREENELLRQSLAKCLDTCLRDISSTFESLSETLVDSAAAFVVQSGEGAGGRAALAQDSSELTNVAQLIADNRHLKQMRGHIETIEQQRRSIFEELSSEKLRNKQLELQLIQCKLDQEQLAEAKRKLERQLEAGARPAKSQLEARDLPARISTLAETATEPQPSTSKQSANCGGSQGVNSVSETLEPQSQADLSDKTTSGSDEQFTTSTFDSIDIYRKYIQSMTPDLDAIRRERRLILDEFDSIKKMLANIND